MPDNLKPIRAYPVLYILPVEAGTGSRWGSSLSEAMKADVANKYEIICVFPTFADLPWYADHPTDARLQQETYFLKTVIPFVEAHYPVSTKSQDRYLLGFSKSGWGAWSLLVRHPDMFHKAFAWDAPLMLDRPGKYGSGDIFGTEDNFRDYDLSRLLSEKPEELVSEPRLYHQGYHGFRAQHEKMNALLEELGIPSVYRDGPDREHHWESGWLADAVELLLADN